LIKEEKLEFLSKLNTDMTHQ